MLELEPIEARVSTRTPRMDPPRADAPQVRFAPIAAFLKGPIFSRTRDIFAANMTELLDRAEDPARMIRMIILEMEETLVEVRAAAARSIADARRCAGRWSGSKTSRPTGPPRPSWRCRRTARTWPSRR